MVTYEPELTLLKRALDALINQVHRIVVVDNGSKENILNYITLNYGESINVILLETNFGIAYAQNVGINSVRQIGATHVLLMDQDSIPSSNMVYTLSINLESRVDAACVGPRYTDTRQNNPPPFIKVRGLRLKRQPCFSVKPIVDVDYLIASGCMIPLAVLERVGLMREDLFIDYIDIEWGLRAKHLGYISYGVCNAVMEHSLGDDPINFLGKIIPVHSPLRHYYHFRNAVLLYRESWISLNWKLVDSRRLLVKFCFYSLITTPRLMHFKMMFLGILHGLNGRTGKFKNSFDGKL